MDATADGWDLVLRGGRVIDPESGLDAVRDVAVAAGRIAAVGTGLTAGVSGGDVDVAGQVVTAGFIDLHSHVSDLGGLRLQAMDGVTTALELEAGVTPVAQAYRRAADEGRPINYGFAASWALARMEAVAGLPPDASLGAFMARISDPAWQRPAEPAQVDALLARLAEDIAEGALGIGVLLGYAPAASPAEYLRVAGLAAEAGVPTFTHARDLIEMVPATLADGAEEIVRAAARDRRPHALLPRQQHLAAAHRPRARPGGPGPGRRVAGHHRGVPVRLRDDRHRGGVPGTGTARRAGPAPSSLTYAPTGERVASADRLRELRATDPGGLVIIDLLSEDDPADRALLMRSLTFPGAVVASDAMPLTWTAPPADPQAWPLPPTAITHPRTAGTFSRALRLLTREGRLALRRPAQPGPGAGQVQPGAGPAAAGPGACPARQGPPAARRRRRHRRVRPGRRHRSGQLPAQHAPVGRDQACPGQRRLRGPRWRPRGRRAAGPPGPRRAALSRAGRDGAGSTPSNAAKLYEQTLPSMIEVVF